MLSLRHVGRQHQTPTDATFYDVKSHKHDGRPANGGFVLTRRVYSSLVRNSELRAGSSDYRGNLGVMHVRDGREQVVFHLEVDAAGGLGHEAVVVAEIAAVSHLCEITNAVTSMSEGDTHSRVDAFAACCGQVCSRRFGFGSNLALHRDHE